MDLATLADLLSRRLGAGAVSTRLGDRLAYARDLWPLTQIDVMYGKEPSPPGIVVWPSTVEEVALVLATAREASVPVVPFGGGSGVCGGALPGPGAISMDLKRLDRVLEIEPDRLVARAQAGILGEELERRLNARGVTLGHFPSSIYCSTLGGWLAARSAGQLSTLYGKIEDRVQDLLAVTTEGEIVRARDLVPGCPALEAAHLLLGTEGTAAVLVEATLALHPVPEERVFLAARFGSVERGLEAIRNLLQAGIVPAAVRLYDHLDTLLVARPHREGGAGGTSGVLSDSSRARRRLALLLALHPVLNLLGPRLPTGCLLLLVFEGPRELVAGWVQAALRLLSRGGGRLLGPDPASRWWEHRYDVSYKQSPVYARGGVVDTIEVAATWGRLLPLYRRMRAAIGRHALVLAHFSHAYREGCSIYFTFVLSASSHASTRSAYQSVWKSALEACLAEGGTITHHHGVGLLKVFAYRRERSGAWPLLGALGNAFDPAGILNPGKLGKSREV